MTLPNTWTTGQTFTAADADNVANAVNAATTTAAAALPTAAVVDNADGTISVGSVIGMEPLTPATAIQTTSAAPAIGKITLYNATSGNLTPTLPPLSGIAAGRRLAVRRDHADTSTNTVTISTNGADTFYSSGATSLTLPLAGEQREFQVVSVSGTKYWMPAGSLNPLPGLDTRYIQNVTALTGAAIQAAMTSFGGNPGIVILRPGSVYLQSSSADQLVIPSNITLMMNGATLKINIAGGIGGPQIINADTTNGNPGISIIGPGVIDGNKALATTSINAMVLHKCSYLTLHNLEIKNVNGRAVEIFGDAVSQSRYVTLSNLNIHDVALLGIWVGNGQRAVNWANVTVHDCGGDGTQFGSIAPSVIVDASEQIVNGLYAYGNTGVGIYIRNVFACTLNNLVATRNGTHGIYSVALTDSVGSNWFAMDNGDATSNTYSDIYFEGTGSPTWGYGTTAATVITGVRCGPPFSFSGSGNWLDSAHPAETGKEAYGIYFEDLIGSFGGDLRLLNIQAFTGLTGTIRYPATMGGLVVTTGREGYDSLRKMDYIPSQVQTIPRFVATQLIGGLASQRVYFAYFTADQAVTINNLTTVTNTTAAGATPTLCRMGIYSIDGSGNLTLLAGTTNDTTIWAATSTPYTKALGSAVSLTPGTRYAMAVLCVTAAAMPSFYGAAVPAGSSAVAPGLVATLSSQSDLPATVTVGSLATTSANLLYVRGS